jgi:hypothetical protein
MKRRDFITLLGGAAAWPLAVRAQQPERVRRIGVLMPFAADDPEAQTGFATFAQGLERLGWTIGRNVRIDLRWAAGDPERIRRGVAELLALGQLEIGCKISNLASRRYVPRYPAAPGDRRRAHEVRITAARRSPVENFRCLAAEGYQLLRVQPKCQLYSCSSPALLQEMRICGWKLMPPPLTSWLMRSPYFFGASLAAIHLRVSMRNRSR